MKYLNGTRLADEFQRIATMHDGADAVHAVHRKRRKATAVDRLMLIAALGFWLTVGLTVAFAAVPPAAGATAADAALKLRARHAALRDQLASNPFKRPLVLESRQTSSEVRGEIYAVLPYPFAKVDRALGGSQQWCDILILHLNTKYCSIAHAPQGNTLLLNVGKKVDQPLDQSFRLNFAWELAEQKSDYLRVRLSAATGPLSTHDYRITLEAVPLDDGATFLHLSYEYGFGVSGRIAMLAYLGTVARNKVGFSVTGATQNGEPAYVDGMRGQQERNTMRYYLAIETFLGALSAPEASRFEKRIADWFDAAERYPRQLHEVERVDYLAMKRSEYRRQELDRTVAAPLSTPPTATR